MQKGDGNSQRLGICQRFINFLLSILSHPGSYRSIEVPIEGPSRNSRKSSIRPSKANGSSASSEIVVEYRHIGALENLKTGVDNFGPSNQVPKKDVLSLTDEQTTLQNGVESKSTSGSFRAVEKHDMKAQDDGLQKDNPLVHEKEPIGTKGLKNGFRNKESNNLLAEGTEVNKPIEETRSNPPRRPWPLLSVASNINEKADAFIKSKKKAMGRNLDPKRD